MRGVTAALLPLLVASALQGQSGADPHAVQPERPTVATHAYEVAPGWAEVEAGLEFDRYPDDSRGASAPVLLKLGVVHDLQFDLQGSVVAPAAGRTGFGDLTLGAKWKAISKSSFLGDFALQPSVTLPTGSASAGTGNGVTGYSILLISSRQIGSVEVDVNAGYTHRAGDGSTAPRDAALWTASFGGPLRGAAGWVLECFGYPATVGPAGAPATVGILGGPTLIARPWLAFDAGIIVRVRGVQPDAFYVGTVYNLGRM